MKTRSKKTNDKDGYGAVRFYTAPHDDVSGWGDNWQHRTKQVEYYHGFENEVVAEDVNVMLRFTQEDHDDFVIVVSKRGLKDALREVGL